MKKIFSLFILVICILFFNNKVLAYEEYKIGDKITYNYDEYYVIENSDSETNYVTLLKVEPFTAKEIDEYAGGEYISKYGDMSYYPGCDSIMVADGECNVEYETSNISTLLKNWTNDNFEKNDLIEIDGYKVRLIEVEDLINNLYYENGMVSPTDYELTVSEKTPEWVYDHTYWTMSKHEDSNNFYYISGGSGRLLCEGFSAFVRPVINLNKCALDDKSCKEDLMCKNGIKYKTEKRYEYSTYNIGDEIEYKGEKYYVIEYSSKKKNYVTLLKSDILTKEEIYKYTNGEYDTENVPYYISDTCNAINNTSGCTTEFSKSVPLTIINNWVNDKLINDDLIEVDGYKARLLTKKDLFTNLGYSYYKLITDYVYKLTEDVPKWVYSNDYSYWTMSGREDSYFYVYRIIDDGSVNSSEGGIDSPNPLVYNISGAVRPVINLNKCAIDGGCVIEEYELEDGCIEDSYDANKNSKVGNNDSMIVKVGNTLKSISNILLVICGILIIGGLSFLSYSYIKSKKEINSNIKK